jgi:putative FmdB family regulatory protein
MPCGHRSLEQIVPTYDYRCRQCGHITEVIHSMTEDGPATCERCGGQLQRILHPAGIIFRGSGFYKTDSRSASSASVPSGTTKGTSSGDKSKTSGSSGTGDSGSSAGSSSGSSASSPPSPKE